MSHININVHTAGTLRGIMMEPNYEYYIIKSDVLPEILKNRKSKGTVK